MTGLKTLAVGDSAAAHPPNDEFAQKMVLAKYSLRKSSSQSNTIAVENCAIRRDIPIPPRPIAFSGSDTATSPV